MPHKAVLVREVLELLNLKKGAVVLDGTLGRAGHTLEILKAIGPEGKLIALDQDPTSIERCRETLSKYPNVSLHHENFENAHQVLDSLNISSLNAVILDIGLSSDQLEDGERGFSFERKGPLDMRMNLSSEISAKDLIKGLSQKELATIFWEYGEERWSRRFAKAIVEQRVHAPIETTEQLVQVLERSLPFKKGVKKGSRPFFARRHPATRVFQALRIAVNQELRVLEKALENIWPKIEAGGRFAVISFHSLEDRIVKHQFRRWAKAEEAKVLTKKPVTATEKELEENPRARSAKLRGVERVK